MRLPSAIKSTVPKVIKPSPPTCMSSISTSCPQKVRSAPGSITVSPVTQVPLVAVNSASTNLSGSPVLITGSVSSFAPSNMSARKPAIITRAGCRSTRLTFSRTTECLRKAEDMI